MTQGLFLQTQRLDQRNSQVRVQIRDMADKQGGIANQFQVFMERSSSMDSDRASMTAVAPVSAGQRGKTLPQVPSLPGQFAADVSSQPDVRILSPAAAANTLARGKPITDKKTGVTALVSYKRSPDRAQLLFRSKNLAPASEWQELSCGPGTALQFVFKTPLTRLDKSTMDDRLLVAFVTEPRPLKEAPCLEDGSPAVRFPLTPDMVSWDVPLPTYSPATYTAPYVLLRGPGGACLLCGGAAKGTACTPACQWAESECVVFPALGLFHRLSLADILAILGLPTGRQSGNASCVRAHFASLPCTRGARATLSAARGSRYAFLGLFFSLHIFDLPACLFPPPGPGSFGQMGPEPCD